MQTLRKILFRAKRIDNGKWIEGYYIQAEGKHFIIKYGMICGNNDFLSMDDEYSEIDPATLSQFTGMYDKNGKHIFENDIVKTQYGRLCVVKWHSSDSHCGWDLEPIMTRENLDLKPPSVFLFCSSDNEVIGNVFDKGELDET